jgi:hypothetical protein
MEKYMQRKSDIECLECHKMFHPKKKQQVFCCRECAMKYNKRNGVFNKSKETKQKLSLSRKGKTPWNKGRKNTPEETQRMIENVKRGWTEEKRNQQAKKQKEIWSNPELLQKHSNIMSALMTDEHKKKISEKTKEAMQNPDIIEKMSQSCLEKYGYKWNCLRPEAKSHITISKKNRIWQNLLGISDSDLEFVLDGYSYDLKKDNTLIEINPTETHNSTYGLYNGKPKESNYHIKKTCVANKHNFECLHIWDWDDQEKIIKLFKTKQKIGGRDCITKEINDKKTVDAFLNTYHLQGSCRGQSVSIGLYYNNELIGLMTFGKPRYNKNYEWELLRLCYCEKFTVIGGTKKMFNYFVEHHDPKNIISYCDKSKFSGKAYLDLNFIHDSYSQPAKHWYNIKTKRHITDNLLRQRGFSQLHGDNDYKLFQKGINNEELMIKAGYVIVFDCGQATYIWRKSSSI